MATERIYIGQEIERNVSIEAKGANNGNGTKIFGFYL